MRKRSIAVVLALLMVCGLVLPVMAAASLKPFADVPEHHWAYESVLQLQAAGLVEGYPDGEYKGQRPMTRYELAMVIARFLAQLDSRIADQLEALRPGMVEEVSAEVSDLIKDEFAKAMAAIDAAKADASAEAKDELEKAKLELAKALEAVEGKPAVETKVVERPFEMTPEVLSLIQEEVAKAVAGLEPAVSQDDLAAVLAEAKAAKADAAKAQAAADAAAADAAKSLEEVAVLKKAAQDAADEAKVAHELALKALAEAAALDDRITSQDLAIAALSDEVKSNKQAMEALIDAKSQVLADSIGDLAAEFEEELAILGVRVTELENLFAVLEDRVADLEVAQAETAAAVDAHLDDHTRMVKLSGKTEVKFQETVVEDYNEVIVDEDDDDFIFPAYKDLMDRDEDEVYETKQKFEQVYELDLTVT
ncbi:MAG: S-layer homology domain-containing protein, partial [Firmicutes bacterium]|nr:S-layer homology domain-containing protein [Bacillota bacterium]